MMFTLCLWCIATCLHCIYGVFTMDVFMACLPCVYGIYHVFTVFTVFTDKTFIENLCFWKFHLHQIVSQSEYSVFKVHLMHCIICLKYWRPMLWPDLWRNRKKLTEVNMFDDWLISFTASCSIKKTNKPQLYTSSSSSLFFITIM